MKNTAIIFVPLVNPDGVALIDEMYQKTKRLTYVRKNRNVYDE